jgi:alpha-ketoglutarate-dependent taurine dioxygenase
MSAMTSFEEVNLRLAAPLAESAAQVVAACRRARLVLVRTQVDEAARCQFWNDLLGASGMERVPVDENARSGEALDNLWSNVEFDPLRQDRFRHSSSAQPLHTDGSYVPESPALVVMFCERPAPEGGATLFLDGEELVRLLAQGNAALLEQLCATPMVFRKGGREVVAPVISHDSRGPLLRWNYYALSNELDMRVRALAEEFQSFVLEVTRRSIPRALRLARGDAVLFHDYRLLHGRERFVARAAGERCLWKGGLHLA